MDRKVFFDNVRKSPFGGSLTASQVEGLNILLDYKEKKTLFSDEWLAYTLATAFHETAHTMQPVKEYGGEAYLKSKKYYPYYGRGYVQLTWDYNYEKYGIKKTPDDALNPEFAAYILFDGMAKGTFTGKKLGDYFNSTTNDPVNARRIINGVDKKDLIAGYYQSFLKAIKASAGPNVIVVEPAGEDKSEPTIENGLWAILRALIKAFFK